MLYDTRRTATAVYGACHRTADYKLRSANADSIFVACQLIRACNLYDENVEYYDVELIRQHC